MQRKNPHTFKPDTNSRIRHSSVGLVDVILHYCLVCSCKFYAQDVTIVIMHVICKKTHILSNDSQSCNRWATKYPIFCHHGRIYHLL